MLNTQGHLVVQNNRKALKGEEEIFIADGNREVLLGIRKLLISLLLGKPEVLTSLPEMEPKAAIATVSLTDSGCWGAITIPKATIDEVAKEFRDVYVVLVIDDRVWILKRMRRGGILPPFDM